MAADNIDRAVVEREVVRLQVKVTRHPVPEAGALPQPLYETTLCPPVPLDQAAYVVARAMFETDRISPMHAARCGLCCGVCFLQSPALDL